MIIRATCPCCGDEYFINLEAQVSESEKLMSITQTEIVDTSKILHEISVVDGIDIETLKTALNTEFSISPHTIPEVIEMLIEKFKMYQENGKIYFKK